MNKALIMAAGAGSRFGHYTESIPKGFIEVCGKPMVTASIEKLLEAGIREIIIGTGYRSELYETLSKAIPEVTCCYSEKFRETNSMYTLYNCRDLIDSDFLLLESDLIYEKKALTELINSHHDTVMLGASLSCTQDEYFIEANDQGFLVDVSTMKTDLDTVTCEFVGIHKISLTFYKEMCRVSEQAVRENPMIGYEFIIRDVARNLPCKVHNIEDLIWHEIDDEKDLLYSEKHICPGLK